MYGWQLQPLSKQRGRLAEVARRVSTFCATCKASLPDLRALSELKRLQVSEGK
jgi:hypothetical protein